LEDEIAGCRQAEIDVIVSLLTSDEMNELGLNKEGIVAYKLEIEFINYPIPDYGVPTSSATFARLIHRLGYLLSSGKSIAIHCRQGLGRSSVLAACLLNRFDIDVSDGFRQIRKARGASVPDTIEQRQWVTTFSASRSINSEHHVS
jgi:protein-tyrosine phosphatase